MDGSTISYLRTFSLPTFALVALLGANLAHASTITLVGQTTVLQGGQAPGSANNYDFHDFGFGPGPKDLTDFTVSTAMNGSNYPGNGSYRYLIAPGASSAFYTGVTYNIAGYGVSGIVATFAALSGGDFDVFLFDNTEDSPVYGNTAIGISANGGTLVSSTSTYSSLSSEVTQFHITGATTEDVFQVVSTSAGVLHGSDGISFSDISSASPVPEPGTLTLIGTGLLGTIAAARRRFVKA